MPLRPRSAALLAVLAGAATSHAQVITADWTGLGSQDWNTPAAWSAAIAPNNLGAPAGTSYIARLIQLPASTYTVRATSNITLDALEINSSRAVLQLTSGEFAVGTGTVTSGTLNMIGGTLRGGSWTVGSSASVLINSSSAILDGITISAGAFKINSGFTPTLRNGLTLGASGQLSFVSSASALRVDGTQSIAGGLLSFAAAQGSTPNLKITTGSTLTLTNTTLAGPANIGAESGAASLITTGTVGVQAGLMRVGSSIANFTNSGSITLASGQTLVAEAVSTLNSGFIAVTGGALQLSGNWQNTGTLSLTSGSITLGGAFSTPTVAAINQSGGTLLINGAWNNTGSTLQMPAAGNLSLNSGAAASITGGTIIQTAGGRFTGGNGTLDGVTIAGGDFRIGSGLVRIRNGLTLTGGDLRIASNGSGLLFSDSTVVDSYDIISEATSSSGAIINLPANGTLTVNPGRSIHGAYTLIGPTSTFNANVGTLLNAGRIAAEGSGRTIGILTVGLTNSGTMEATGGGVLRIAATSFTNQGTVNATDGKVVLAGPWTSTGAINLGGTGTLELANPFATPALSAVQRTGGTLTVSTTWDNSGQAFDLVPFGPIELNSFGTIQGGTIRQNAVNRIVGRFGYLNDVTIDGGLTLGFNETLNITGGGVRLTSGGVNFVSASSLRFFGAHSLDNVSIVSADSSSGGTIGLVDGASLTLGPGVAISGPGSIASQETTSGPFNFALNFHGTLNIAGSASGISRGYTVNVPNAVSDGLMRASTAGTLNIQNLTNSGLIEAASGGLVVLGPTVRNAPSGTIRALAGGRVQFGLNATFTDDALGGTIDGVAGDIEIAGIWNHAGRSFALNAETGSWKLRNGTINGGELVLADGQTLRLAPFTGSSSDPGGGTLNNLTISGGDWIATGGSARITGTLAVPSGDIRLRGAALDLSTGFTLTTPSQFIADSGTSAIRIARSGFVLAPSTTIRGAGLTISSSIGQNISWESAGLISADRPGAQVRIDNYGGTFTNSGILEARGGGSLIAFTMVNGGTARALDGTLELSSFSGTGPLQVGPQGSLNLAWFTGAGTDDLAGLTNSGGAVNIVGQWDNTGRTFAFTPTSGDFNLGIPGVGTAEPRFGTILGGTLDVSSGRRLNISHGTLNNVRIVGGGLSVPSGALLTVYNGLDLPEGVIQVASGAEVDFNAAPDPGTVLSGLTILASSPATQPVTTIGLGNRITLDASSTIRGGNIRFLDSGFLSFAQFNGSVIADVPGTTIGFSTTIGLLPWINNGTFLADGGRIFLGYRGTAGNLVSVSGSTSNLRLNGGTWIAAHGGTIDIDPLVTLIANSANISIIGPNSHFDALAALRTNSGLLTLDEGASLALSSPIGLQNTGTITLGEQSLLSLTGPGLLGPSSILQYELGAPESGSRLVGSGLVTLGGELRLILPAGVFPQPGDTYRVLQAQSLSGDFGLIMVPSLPQGLSFQTLRDGQSLAFQVVPAPGAAIAILLAAPALVRRRRH
jgi:hypothetical protein